MSTPAGMTPEMLYRVTGQRQVSRLEPGGRVIDYYEFSFATASGGSGSILVPVAQASPDFVRERIRDEVERIETIMSLTG